MLAKCLESIETQGVPIIVVDNDPEPHEPPHMPANATLIHETRRGISHARNAGLDAALRMGAEWLAFLDDDEIAPANWIEALHAAAQEHQADAISAPAIRVPDGQAPAWSYKKRRSRERFRIAEGAELRVAQTNNILFRLAPVRRHGHRFAEELGITGGSDYDFFYRFTAAGARLIRTNRLDAQVIEAVPVERLSFYWQVRQSYNQGHCAVRDAHLLGQGIAACKRKAAKRSATGVIRLLTAPFAILLGYNTFMRTTLSGAKKLAEAAGIYRALSGKTFAYYAEITGG